ncbi:MAG: hypothetical protein ACI4L6_02990 [Candidatus Onthoplasma sp.]
MKKQKQLNQKIAFLLVVMLSLMVLISPLETYCVTAEPSTQIEENLDKTIIEELNEIDFSELNLVVKEFDSKKTNLFSISNIKKKVYEIISGSAVVDYSDFFAFIFSNLIEMIVKYLPMLSIIIGIGVITNLLNGLKGKFNEKSTGNLIQTVGFLTAVVLVIGIISSLTDSTGNTISSMVNQMNCLFPIMLTLMASVGANASVSAFQPIVAILSTYIADIFNYFIVPLFTLSFVFSILSNISDNVKLDKFSSFISGVFKWSIGLIFMLFFAIFSIQGITMGSFDSLSIRTTKYTIRSYVPVMGGYLSDGMDIILSSTILIKNSIGLVGVLLIISTILSPVIEIAICSLVFKLISAILQPLGSSKLSNFLSSTSKSITILSSSVIAIGFMYLLSMGLMMSVSNVVL